MKEIISSIQNGYKYSSSELNIYNSTGYSEVFDISEQINLEHLAKSTFDDPSYLIHKHFFIQHHFKGKYYLWGNRDRISEENLYIFDFLTKTLTKRSNALPDNQHISWGISVDDNEKFIYLGLGHQLIPDPNGGPTSTIYNQVNKLYKFNPSNLSYSLLTTLPLAESPHLASAIYHKGYIYVACSFSNATASGLPDSSGIDNRLYKINTIDGSYVRINCPYTQAVWGKPRLYIDNNEVLKIVDGFLGYEMSGWEDLHAYTNATYGEGPYTLKRVVSFNLNTSSFISIDEYTSNTYLTTDPCSIKLGNNQIILGGTPFTWEYTNRRSFILRVSRFLPSSIPNQVSGGSGFPNYSEVESLDSNTVNLWGYTDSFDIDSNISADNILPFFGVGNKASYFHGNLVVSSLNDYVEQFTQFDAYTGAYDGRSYIRNDVLATRIPPTITYLKLNNYIPKIVEPYKNWIPLNNTGVEPKYAHSSFALNGKIYITGGYNNTTYSRKTYEYTIETDTWRQVADAPFSHYEGESCVHNGKAYVFGSYALAEDHKSLSQYSPPDELNPDGVWTVLSTIPYNHPEGTLGRFYASYIIGIDNFLFVGFSFGAWNSRYMRLLRYDLVNNIWLEMFPAPYVESNVGHMLGFIDNKLYFFMGSVFASVSGRHSYIDFSDVDNPILYEGGALSYPSNWNVFAMCAVIGGKLMTFGGRYVAYYNYNYVYSPHSNSWDVLLDSNSSPITLPAAMAQGTFAVHNNCIYYFGGYNGSTGVNTFYKLQFV